jgi:hypothetical protein
LLLNSLNFLHSIYHFLNFVPIYIPDLFLFSDNIRALQVSELGYIFTGTGGSGKLGTLGEGELGTEQADEVNNEGTLGVSNNGGE